MAARHESTLAKVFSEPTPAGLKWREIEAMFGWLGAEVSEGRGSRIRISLNGIAAVFHRPHPEPDTKRYAVRNVRDFLIAARIRPDSNGST